MGHMLMMRAFWKGGLVGGLLLAGVMPAAAQDQPVDLGQDQLGDSEVPLRVTGFGVIHYGYDGKTRENSFAASKLAAGFFREITDHAYVFGQLTAVLEEDEASGAVVTETEIDNLLLSVTPPGLTDLTLEFGKLDAPIGFERDDEPLVFLASPSFNFELARPAKMVGLLATWSASPALQVSGMYFNGWDADVDPNRGKTDRKSVV